MKTRILSVLLLVNFFVLLTPREWWHHCDHHEAIEFSHSDTHFDDGSCNFCEFDLGSFTIHNFHFFTAKKQLFIAVSVAEITNKEQAAIQSFLLRGPPSSC